MDKEIKAVDYIYERLEEFKNMTNVETTTYLMAAAHLNKIQMTINCMFETDAVDIQKLEIFKAEVDAVMKNLS